jgi:hypothetical protein
MRLFYGMATLALVAAAPAIAQPRDGLPPGSYQGQCSDMRVNGEFLSATCRGARGGGQSSIRISSCAGDIGVDASGALSCAGPGAAAPLPPAYAPAQGHRDDPGYGAKSGGSYPQFRGLEEHIRREIQEGVREDLIEQDDAQDLFRQLRDIQRQEAREFRVHGWNLPDDDRRRIQAQLDQLDRLVDGIKAEP